MVAWIAENWLTLVVLAVVAAVVALAAISLLRDKKKGKSSCGGNCSACALGGTCHKR